MKKYVDVEIPGAGNVKITGVGTFPAGQVFAISEADYKYARTEHPGIRRKRGNMHTPTHVLAVQDTAYPLGNGQGIELHAGECYTVPRRIAIAMERCDWVTTGEIA